MRKSTYAVIGGHRSKITVALIREKQILEWLFPTDWFADRRNEHHPALAQWKLCNQMIGWRGLKPDSTSPSTTLTLAAVAST